MKLSNILNLYTDKRDGRILMRCLGVIHPHGFTVCHPFPITNRTCTPYCTIKNTHLIRLSGASLFAVIKKHIALKNITANILERLKEEIVASRENKH